MRNFISSGADIQIPAPSGGVVGGNIILMGTLPGIVNTTAAQGELVTVSLRGAFSDVPKVSGTAFTTGDKLYWDATAGNLTKTASGNTYVGYAYADAASAATVCTLLLSH